MTSLDSADHLEPELRDCLQRRGFEALTPVQVKVLDPAVGERDLRVTSQTGSGKTVAIGLLLRHSLRVPAASEPARFATARALIVVPTRELAKQVHQELTWLYQPLGLRLACATGGASYVEERRALAMNPTVVIGTPGRLIDHIERGALNLANVESIVLDEADRMLDMGFTEAIESIFAAAPNRKRTHLVSATLEPAVLRLANRFQSSPLHIEGTRYGDTHADIEHRAYLVAPQHRIDALVNLLLLSPNERTLVFARTRVDVGDIAEELSSSGFRVAALSGDMEQPARDRALAAFRDGKVTVLVATDVAARGIDVQNMTRVIQVDPPGDPESYTHRSGRTGRAGQKGTSIVLLAPSMQRRFAGLLAQARIQAKFLPMPSPAAVRAAADERTLTKLGESLTDAVPTDRLRSLAERLLTDRDAVSVVATLIAKHAEREPAPREVPVIFPEAHDKKGRKATLPQGRDARASRGTSRGPAATRFDEAPRRGDAPYASERTPRRDSSSGRTPFETEAPRNRAKGSELRNADSATGYGMFRITWGQLQGADARRVLAVVCRRGGIRGADVGAIRIGPTNSIIEVKTDVLAEFQSRALLPDPEEPRIRITPLAQNGTETREPGPMRHRPEREAAFATRALGQKGDGKPRKSADWARDAGAKTGARPVRKLKKQQRATA